MSSESSERNKREYYALVNFLINDLRKDQSIRNFIRIMFRLAKATWIYYKKQRRV